jgi:hypothetical protein
MAGDDAGVTFIQCNNQMRLARKRIRFQVMRTSWRKRKKTITPLLPATYHNNAQPFNHWENVNTMAIPDYFLGMHFIRRFSRSPEVADLPRESTCGSLDPLLSTVMYKQLPDAMVTPDTKVDIEIKKGAKRRHYRYALVSWALWLGVNLAKVKSWSSETTIRSTRQENKASS